jgi:hypothetical protein
MMIDRREFIAGATLAFVAPAIPLLPSVQPVSAASQNGVVFMIRGWSVPDDGAGANQVWMTVSNSWRTAWR